MAADSDKRRHPRLSVEASAKFRVPTKKMDISMASLKNISGGGVCMLTSNELEPGQNIQVEFGLATESATLMALGEVVWVAPVNDPEIRFKYQIGVKFVDLEKDKEKSLNQFVVTRLKSRIKEEIEKSAGTRKKGARRYSLLCIDDDKVTIELMKKIFGSEFNVITAMNGYEGVELARQWRPDMILLDIVMPDMDGFSTLMLLKDFDETRDIPVIMLSVLKDKSKIFQAIRAGAQDYILKPFSVDKLIVRINKIVEDKKQNADA